MEYKSFDERFDWLLGFMAQDDPFTHELLMLLERVEVNSMPTMGVAVEGLKMILGYNRKYFESLTDDEVMWVFAHEMFHLALHHCTGRKPTDKDQQRRHNIAADLAVNCLVRTGDFRRTPRHGVLFPKQFGFPEKLSMEQYYDMLPNSPDKGGEGGKGGGGKDEDKDGEGGSKDEDKDGKGGGRGDKDGEQPCGSHGGFDVHDGWSEEEDSVADEIIRQKIREMENSDRYWGSMSADEKEVIVAAQRSTTAWHRLLRVVYGSLLSRGVIHTFKRPNRRFGYPYTGFKREYTDRVLLLWDTSGSCWGKEEQSKFLAETNRIAELMPVDVLMFDAGIQGKVIPFNRKMRSFPVSGGGGTSFKEPFEYADRMHYRTVICLTDGCAPAIEKPRYVKDTIWAIIGAGNKPPVDWGRVVNIDTINGRHVAPPVAALAA